MILGFLMKKKKRKKPNILWFDKVDKKDVALVGGKGANLGEMASFGIPMPQGFIITSTVYFDFLKKNQLIGKIRKALKHLDQDDQPSYHFRFR